MTTGFDVTQADQQLRLAVMHLANAPQSQRRCVQMGWMQRSIENLVRIASGELDGLQRAGKIDAEQAELIAELHGELERRMAASEDFLEERDAGPREFLFGTALENAEWHAVRHLARRCHSALAGPESPLAAIRAR